MFYIHSKSEVTKKKEKKGEGKCEGMELGVTRLKSPGRGENLNRVLQKFLN